MTTRPLSRGRLSSLSPPFRSTRRKAPALVIALAAVAYALAAVPASADPSIASKEAQAQSVLGQIQQLDSSLERAIEAYNLANVKLNKIKHDLSSNTFALASAKKSLKSAQTQLSSRLVDIYTSGDQNAGLAVLLVEDTPEIAVRQPNALGQSTPANTGSRSWPEFSRPASAPASEHSAR